MDGPGADALFGDVGGGGGIHKVATDPDGKIYTYDEGTGKFKVIGTDKDRTVATIGVITSKDDNVMGLTWLKGKLYVTGVDGNNDFLQVVDPAKYKAATPKANVTDVYRARDHFEDVEAGHQAITSQIYNDGEALIMSSQGGFVWRVDTDGTVLSTLAGSGAFIEFGADFDPTKPHAAKDWELVSRLSNPDGGPWLAFAGTKMFWTGGAGIAKYTLQIACE
jgi:DNA-binding beta-propeller fold protein YncE